LRPLIPRVRIGDILLGTRNLRRYLQTAATLSYVKEVGAGVSAGRARAVLYRPSKEDQFLVTVNAWEVFGAHGLNCPVTLLFANPTTGGPAGRSVAGNSSRMNPTLFSKWFIRTPRRMVDLADWPAWACYMKMSLHLNLGNSRDPNAPAFNYGSGCRSPFTTQRGKPPWTKNQLIAALEEWAPRGITRLAPARGGGKTMHRGGCGPLFDEIPAMQDEIRERCSNPRIARHLKAENNEYLSSDEFLKVLLKANK
jgi:hypothetical protein